MKTFTRCLILTLTAALLWSFTQTAKASHFRFANLSWKRAPGANPLAVEITVTEAWRISSGGIGEIFYQLGDGSGNFSTSTATRIATLTDAAGEQYEVWRYSTSHTYPSNGLFTVSGTSCCRISSLNQATVEGRGGPGIRRRRGRRAKAPPPSRRRTPFSTSSSPPEWPRSTARAW